MRSRQSKYLNSNLQLRGGLPIMADRFGRPLRLEDLPVSLLYKTTVFSVSADISRGSGDQIMAIQSIRSMGLKAEPTT